MELSEIIVRARAMIVRSEAHYANDDKVEAAQALASMSVLIQENLGIMSEYPEGFRAFVENPDKHEENQN